MTESTNTTPAPKPVKKPMSYPVAILASVVTIAAVLGSAALYGYSSSNKLEAKCETAITALKSSTDGQADVVIATEELLQTSDASGYSDVADIKAKLQEVKSLKAVANVPECVNTAAAESIAKTAGDQTKVIAELKAANEKLAKDIYNHLQATVSVKISEAKAILTESDGKVADNGTRDKLAAIISELEKYTADTVEPNKYRVAANDLAMARKAVEDSMTVKVDADKAKAEAEAKEKVDAEAKAKAEADAAAAAAAQAEAEAAAQAPVEEAPVYSGGSNNGGYVPPSNGGYVPPKSGYYPPAPAPAPAPAPVQPAPAPAPAPAPVQPAPAPAPAPAPNPGNVRPAGFEYCMTVGGYTECKIADGNGGWGPWYRK